MAVYRQRSLPTMYIFCDLVHKVRVYALSYRLQTYKHWDESIGQIYRGNDGFFTFRERVTGAQFASLTSKLFSKRQKFGTTLEMSVFYKLEPRHNHVFWKRVMRPIFRSSIVVNFLKNVTGKDAKDQTPRDFFENGGIVWHHDAGALEGRKFLVVFHFHFV